MQFITIGSDNVNFYGVELEEEIRQAIEYQATVMLNSGYDFCTEIVKTFWTETQFTNRVRKTFHIHYLYNERGQREQAENVRQISYNIKSLPNGNIHLHSLFEQMAYDKEVGAYPPYSEQNKCKTTRWKEEYCKRVSN